MKNLSYEGKRNSSKNYKVIDVSSMPNAAWVKACQTKAALKLYKRGRKEPNRKLIRSDGGTK